VYNNAHYTLYQALSNRFTVVVQQKFAHMLAGVWSFPIIRTA
jgi:hypothetical protein